MKKDFWHNSKVVVIGSGSWGTVLANLVARNSVETRLWSRDEEQVRAMNATRVNAKYLPNTPLHERIQVVHSLDRLFEGGVRVVIWALPSSACREQAKQFARYLTGDEIVIHATKGVEPVTLKRVSEILKEELPCARIGVISGPNLAQEVARGDPSAAVVASRFDEVIECGQVLFTNDNFRVYGSYDVIGVEWAGALKNVLAIASGALESLGLGWNAKALLITRGLVELARFGMAMGGKEPTFLGLAGLGDLLATSNSTLSRNYRVGMAIAKGEKLPDILSRLGGTAEGVKTATTVREFAVARGIPMPITEGVYQLLQGNVQVGEAIRVLMTRPLKSEWST
ncbi:MAG: glycerol-3-phosphate dehydrogenase [Bdellovibrionales bacterium GWB1_55_8]|nr:MAG: glycerol-3-phosphate dehydrogenase [Bdellovibrionales bacterium GWB1_55_8]